MTPDTLVVIPGTGGIDPTTVGGYVVFLVTLTIAMVCHLSMGER